MLKLFAIKSIMRSLIFILTLLIALQPAAWAVKNCVSSTVDQSNRAASVSALESVLKTPRHDQVNSSVNIESGCLNMTGPMVDNAMPDCSACLNGCTTASLMDTPPSRYVDIRSTAVYLAPTPYVFISLTAPPEPRPPQTYA